MSKKVGVVTGSSKGIGKAIAIAFAKSGEYFAVIANARKFQEAQIVSDEIRTLGCNSIPIEADISKEADCIRLIEETIKNYGRIDVLVNNAGVEMMTKTLASELAKSNIRANAVAPGAIETPMNVLLDENEVARHKTLAQIPMGRIGSAEEVANAVEFLASDKASYITGTTLYVDGGMTLYPSFQYTVH